ncbi:MAG: hypothetical protein AB7O59_07725 [Pirellulales bacterium]
MNAASEKFNSRPVAPIIVHKALALQEFMSSHDGIIGVSDHGGWAVLVTAASDGTLLDRRRVELVDEDLPKIPHHSEGQALPLAEAVALVERVRESAHRHAMLRLDSVAMQLPGRILGVALRQCPALPPTTAERIKDYRAQNVADWVMYRQALAAAAEARGWAVHWYDAKNVLDAASEALRIEDLDAYFVQLRKTIGSPWGKDHRLAMAAAIVAARALEVGNSLGEKAGRQKAR